MNAHPVIALVCSAGGLDAVSAVLGPLPADLPATVIVLQHSCPDKPEMLAHILDRRTALPVTAAAEGDELTPARVLVAPPGSHTLITADARIAMIPVGAGRPTGPLPTCY